MSVVYYLGAGASFNALPVVNQFGKRIEALIKEIEDETSLEGSLGSVDPNSSPRAYSFIETLKWIRDSAKSHASIDTYAKKLFFLRDSEKLNRLKAGINAFFIIEQARREVDMRYDAFLASIMQISESHPKIPESVRFLTWNYDNQLEKSYFSFTENHEVVNSELLFNHSKLFHINGHISTTTGYNQGEGIIHDINTTNLSEAVARGLNYFSKFEKEGRSATTRIRYAWEEDSNNVINNTINELFLDDVGKCVVIGYSFPYFNREIDSKLIGSMSSLENVYVQCPTDVYNSVEAKISSICRGLPNTPTIRHIADLESFHIPF